MRMRYLASGTVALAVLFTAYAAFYALTTPARQMTPGMTEQPARNPTPPVKGFYRGEEVLFIHTEASDRQVAGMLTRMMGPQVLTVPSLARIPQELLAAVYVFTNGIKGPGPFGFQADVFDAAPGDARYTPLRRVILVAWKSGATPRLLRSVDGIQAAARKGEVTLDRPGVVVNMPFLAWPGGQR